jgi:predicted CXXCH cytochrome family protein
MKKLLFIGIGSAMMVTMGGIGSAQADAGPHSIHQGSWNLSTQQQQPVATEGATQCANCHRAHTAQGQNMLVQAQPALCLNCHGTLGSSLDVADGVDSANAALRGGGFTNAQMNAGSGATKTLSTTGSRVSSNIAVLGIANLKTPTTSTHQIDGATSGTMWGNGTNGVGTTAVTLECGACHDPHGNGNYRILKPVPDGAGTAATLKTAAQVATYTPGANPKLVTPYVPAVYGAGTAPINIPDQAAKIYTTTDYWAVAAPGVPPTLNGVALPNVSEPSVNATTGIYKGATPVTDGFLGNISAWCTTCHTRYLSVAGVANTNSGDAIYTYKHRSDEGASGKPNCIQCHVAHGTNAKMNSGPDGTPGAAKVTQPTGNDAATGKLADPSKYYANSSLLRVDDRGTCLMCHAVGSVQIPTPK